MVSWKIVPDSETKSILEEEKFVELFLFICLARFSFAGKRGEDLSSDKYCRIKICSRGIKYKCCQLGQHKNSITQSFLNLMEIFETLEKKNTVLVNTSFEPKACN